MDIKLISKKNAPTVVVMLDNKTYCIPLKHAIAIQYFNRLLRTLDTGIEIKFESYSQYAKLLMDVTEALEQKKTTA